jgi:hypothetical protein
MITTPFYKKALTLFTKTQETQIKKGLEKYPEPFNPHSWTPEELLNHALEETVDLTHYLVGLKELLDAKDKEIARLQVQLDLALGKTLEPKQVSYSDQDDQY